MHSLLANFKSMGRAKTKISLSAPYHITARSHNRDRFPVDLDSVWEIMNRYLFSLGKFYGAEIISFVLMPNHFHLLARFPLGNISQAMQYFMYQTSKELGRASNRINQIYGARYYKSLIDSYNYYLIAYKYVYQNPIRAQLCDRAEEYRYSTLSMIIGQRHMLIPIIEDTVLFSPDFCLDTLSWLNRKSDATKLLIVKKALRRSTFSLLKENSSGRKIEIDSRSF